MMDVLSLVDSCHRKGLLGLALEKDLRRTRTSSPLRATARGKTLIPDVEARALGGHQAFVKTVDGEVVWGSEEQIYPCAIAWDLALLALRTFTRPVDIPAYRDTSLDMHV